MNYILTVEILEGVDNLDHEIFDLVFIKSLVRSVEEKLEKISTVDVLLNHVKIFIIAEGSVELDDIWVLEFLLDDNLVDDGIFGFVLPHFEDINFGDGDVKSCFEFDSEVDVFEGAGADFFDDFEISYGELGFGGWLVFFGSLLGG